MYLKSKYYYKLEANGQCYPICDQQMVEYLLFCFSVVKSQPCVADGEKSRFFFISFKTTQLKMNKYYKSTSVCFSAQMGDVWNELQPKLGCLFGGSNGLKHIWAQRGRSGGRPRAHGWTHRESSCAVDSTTTLNAHIHFHTLHSIGWWRTTLFFFFGGEGL